MFSERREPHARAAILKKYGKNVNCFRYHLELVRIFEEGIPFYDGNHVLTLMPNNKMYDKSGMRMYDMRQEPRIYKQAHSWGDINHQKPTVEERLEVIERMIGVDHAQQ